MAAIRWAFAQRPAETLAQMCAAITAMDAAAHAHDPLTYARADAEFHGSIVRNSANAFVIEAYKLVSGRVGALRVHNLTGSSELRIRSSAAHRAIARAFEKGDLPLAEELIDEHVSRMSIAYRAAVRRGRPGTRGRRVGRVGTEAT